MDRRLRKWPLRLVSAPSLAATVPLRNAEAIVSAAMATPDGSSSATCAPQAALRELQLLHRELPGADSGRWPIAPSASRARAPWHGARTRDLPSRRRERPRSVSIQTPARHSRWATTFRTFTRAGWRLSTRIKSHLSATGDSKGAARATRSRCVTPRFPRAIRSALSRSGIE